MPANQNPHNPALAGAGATPRNEESICPGFSHQARVYDPPLDLGIGEYVDVLADAGIETFESCEGGEGHSYPEPTIRFHGDRAEGFKALSVALRSGLPISALRRMWPIVDGEPHGPCWEMVFFRPGVAKSGNAPALGAGGQGFKSSHPDQLLEGER